MAVSAPPDAAFSDHGDTEVPTASRLLERSEVAERLRISERTVRRLAAAGRLTEVLVSDRSPRILESSVEAHIAAHVIHRGGHAAVTAA